MPYAHRVAPGSKVRLNDVDPADTQGLKKIDQPALLDPLGNELKTLVELMYAAGTHSLLVVLQGRDTAGKDGCIRRILDVAPVQGTRVIGFKVPTDDELAHDFLWRIHKQTPAKGAMTVFNRSHYEDVLVVRVHNLVPKEVWGKRYAAINAFEQNLVDSGTLVVKFALHISKGEQKERLLAREEDPEKSWKLSVGDWKEREHWDAYTEAYDDALAKCSTAAAPWYVVPADKKWFRDLAVLETLVATMRPYKRQWQEALEERGRLERAAIEAWRQSHPANGGDEAAPAAPKKRNAAKADGRNGGGR